MSYRFTSCPAGVTPKLQRYSSGTWYDLGYNAIELPCQTTYTTRTVNVADAPGRGIRFFNGGTASATLYVDWIKVND
jgi:hypothetical protein